MVMPVTAPVPTEAMRSGRLSEAPDIVTRTGRMACTPWLGRSFMARKSKPSLTYWSRMGCTAAGMLKPFCVSQASSALESFECSCTVEYGPTFACESTCTTAPASEAAPLPANAADGPWRLAQFGQGQLAGGGLICVAVSVSIELKSTSALRPTVTEPWMGSTQANEVGEPEYS